MNKEIMEAPISQQATESAEQSDTERAKVMAQLNRLATLLDSSIPLPGGYRVGLDGFIGLVPIAGDSAAAALSSYIVIRAAQLGVATRHLVRMMLNIMLEASVGIIPVLGDLFDFAWKANERNMAILQRHLPAEAPRHNARRRLTGATLAVLLIMFLILIAIIVVAAKVFITLFAMLTL